MVAFQIFDICAIHFYFIKENKWPKHLFDVKMFSDQYVNHAFQRNLPSVSGFCSSLRRCYTTTGLLARIDYECLVFNRSRRIYSSNIVFYSAENEKGMGVFSRADERPISFTHNWKRRFITGTLNAKLSNILKYPPKKEKY